MTANAEGASIAYVHAGVVLEGLLERAEKHFEAACRKSKDELGVVYDHDPAKDRLSTSHPDHPYFEKMYSVFRADDETWEKIKAVLKEEEAEGAKE
ncbi:MAG: hypothetical protein ABSE08_00705 [Syntrophobacteraceae bacterium]